MSNKEIIGGFEVTELGLYRGVGNYEADGCLGIYSDGGVVGAAEWGVHAQIVMIKSILHKW